jgi:signal peptidase II
VIYEETEFHEMTDNVNVMSRVRRAWILAGATLALLAFDRVTKLIAMTELADRPAEDFLWGLLRLVYQENHGAMLSLGAGLPESIRFLFFTVLVLLVLVVLLLIVLLKRIVATKDVIAAALVLGGGLGNVIDRLLYDGAVLDFLNIGVGDLRTGVFNVADVAILAGALVFLFGPRTEPPPRPHRQVPPEVHSPAE